MNTYANTLKAVRESIHTDSFRFPEYNALDYTGIGFGYNLKDGYPKTMKEARKDLETPYFDRLLKLASK